MEERKEREYNSNQFKGVHTEINSQRRGALLKCTCIYGLKLRINVIKYGREYCFHDRWKCSR